jgi:hypothetical protein
MDWHLRNITRYAPRRGSIGIAVGKAMPKIALEASPYEFRFGGCLTECPKLIALRTRTHLHVNCAGLIDLPQR